MLNRLVDSWQSLTMSLAATSKHIKVLERVGLVEQTIAGRRHVCRLVALPLAPAADWLHFYERHWGSGREVRARGLGTALHRPASPRAKGNVQV